MTNEDIQNPSLTSTNSPDSTFHTEQVFTVAGGHFIHDTFSAFISPLLPLIQERFSTSYTLTGSLAIYAQLPSLLNPLIGYIADKVSVRYFVILAPAVTATLMSLMGLAPSYLSLVFLLLAAGVSIAAFHAPAPAMIGRISGTRTGRGMSIFMASGELGRTLGPILAVAGVNWFMLDGIWRLMFVGWAASAILYVRLKDVAARPAAYGRSEFIELWPSLSRVLGVFTWMMLARAFMIVALTTYLPLFMKDALQTSLWVAGSALAILEGAGVVGALMSGTLSDSLGRERMLYILFGIAPFFFFGFLYFPQWMVIPMLIALGLTAISPTAVMMAAVQDKFPNNRAIANGFFLAGNFLARALAIWAVGFSADKIGLFNTFVWCGIVAFASIPAIPRLKLAQ
jgi:FSR family fosmidomycin resistance protein-like MFS transporter